MTVLVFGWHMFWWGLIKPQPLPEKRVSAHSEIRYLPISADNEDPRLQEILAPLIFATPSIAGFSQPLLQKGAESVPPLRIVKDLSVQLARTPSEVTRGKTVESSGIIPEVKQRLATFKFDVSTPDPFGAQQVRPGVSLHWQGELSGHELQNTTIPAVWVSLTNRSWEVSAEISFDDTGLVQRVFRQSSEDRQLEDAVLDWAWRLRAKKALSSRKTTLIVRTNP